jgi:hypothetical protein
MKTGERRLALAGLCVAAALLLGDALAGRAVFFDRDIHWVRYAQAETLALALAQGAWPWWDPHPTFGAPALADPSFQLAYPTTWLNALLPPPEAYALFVLAHLLWAGLGLFALGRAWGLGRAPAFVACVAWVSCGPFLSFANLFHHFAGLAWVPWVLVALEGLLARPGRRSALLLGVVGAMQVLAGSGDMGLMGALLAAGRVAAWARGAPLRRAQTMALGLAALLALAASAVQWLPTLSILREGSRLGLPASTKLYWSMAPAQVIDWVVPRLVADLPLSTELRARWFEGRAPFLSCLYVGLPMLLLAALGAWAGQGRRRLALISAVGVFTLFALGRFTPVYTAVCALPAFGSMRYPVKYMALVGMLLALMAGVGCAAWLAPWGRREARSARALAVLALGVGFAAGLAATALHRPPDWLRPAWAMDGDPSFASPRVAWVAALALALAALLVARARAARPPMALTAVLLALLLGDLVVAGRGVNALAPPELAGYRPPWIARARAEGVQRLYVVPLPAPEDELAPPPPGLPRAWWWALGVIETLAPPVGGRFGLDGSYDGDFTGLAPTWLGAASGFMAQAYSTPPGLRLLQLGSVDAVLTLREETALGPEILNYRSSFRSPARLYRVPDPLPRAYVVDGARVAPDDHAYRLLGESVFDPRREVLLGAGTSRRPGPGQPGTARVVERRADALTVDVDLSRDGHLVVTDAWSPGWTAEVDDSAAPVLRANVLFRAVALSAGRHLVVLRYRPLAARAGALLSALTWLACAAFGLAGWGQARLPAAGGARRIAA